MSETVKHYIDGVEFKSEKLDKVYRAMDNLRNLAKYQLTDAQRLDEQIAHRRYCALKEED